MAEVKKKKKQLARKPSSVKRARQSLKRAARNLAHASRVRNAIKRLRQVLAAKDKAAAGKQLPLTLALIAQMTNKGILHRNAAARYTSRLQRQFNTL